MKRLLLVFSFMLHLVVNAQHLWQPVFHELGKEQIGVQNTYNQFWDDKGRLWMACDKGIACFNGYQTHTWSHDDKDANSILSNTIQTIYVDKKGEMWIAYLDTLGITRFNPEKNEFKHFLPDSSKKNSLPYALVVTFKEDSKGRFWILTWDGGLVKFNTQTGHCTNYIRKYDQPHDGHQPFSNRIKGFWELEDGTFLLGYFGGGAPSNIPSYFNPDTEEFYPFPLEDYLKETDPGEAHFIRSASNIINSFYMDKKGNWWWSSYSGLIYLDNEKKTAERVSGISGKETILNLENARGIIEDEFGNLWVATSNTGIMVVNPETKLVKYIRHNPRIATSLNDNRIRTLKKDSKGNIWVSTGHGSFNIYIPIINQFRFYPWEEMGLEYSNRSAQIIPVNMMVVKNSREIYLSHNYGFVVYDPELENVSLRFSPFDFPGGNRMDNSKVGDFAFRNDTVYFTTSAMNGYFTEKDKRVIEVREKNARRGYFLFFRHNPEKPDHQYHCISYHTGKSLIAVFNPKNNTLDTFHIFKDSISLQNQYSYVLNDKQWLLPCGPTAFMIFDPASKESKIYGPKQKYHFPDSTITMAYRDEADNIWILTENGIYSFDHKTGKSELLNEKFGIENGPANAMIRDRSGIYWIALKEELLRWDRKNDKSYLIKKDWGIRVGQFLPSIAQMDEKGRIYIASLSGILSFDPKSFNIPDEKPRLFLSGISVGSDTLNIEDSLHYVQQLSDLKWNQNNLEFDFYTDILASPRALTFSYRVVGLDSSWINHQLSNHIRLNNIPHGNYVLEVKTTNAYDIESEILQIPFTIQRPFWLAWWFYVLVVAFAAVLVWIYIKYRERIHLERQLILEKKVEERTAEVVEKAKEISLQKDIIEIKNKELTDSIHYAQRIQQSILPSDVMMKKSLPEHFVFFKPKDIVSGDFYWHAHHNNSILWSVVDCTGHGVPGGFMSMLGAGLLNQIVNEEKEFQPDQILNQLRHRVIIALRQTGKEGENRDGMDISFCRLLHNEMKLQFAGANNSVFIVRNGQILELKADKQPIGIHIGDDKPFTLHEIQLEKGDIIYQSSDGYSDQFGGEKGKKFKSSNFEKLLCAISTESIQKQMTIISETFNTWKGEFEQLDDVCVIGVKI
ncbi:MAG: SpoIIE family protein phosphatase [Flavobacteriales bacterium]|nr:SpoIIE family protein phosphatase [Flavobacteriales bacterium]